jgi:serine phosphatase RsbU (regulator of sigma subunit)
MVTINLTEIYEERKARLQLYTSLFESIRALFTDAEFQYQSIELSTKECNVHIDTFLFGKSIDIKFTKKWHQWRNPLDNLHLSINEKNLIDASHYIESYGYGHFYTDPLCTHEKISGDLFIQICHQLDQLKEIAWNNYLVEFYQKKKAFLELKS